MRVATARITREPIRTEALLEGLTTPMDGAAVVFLGVVRNENEGREVSGLEYEVYETMANRVLAEIAEEAERRFATDRVRILHRVGRLSVGEISAGIAVATPHRAEAYETSRYIIEEIKSRLPVWKKEQYVGGDAEWVGEGT